MIIHQSSLIDNSKFHMVVLQNNRGILFVQLDELYLPTTRVVNRQTPCIYVRKRRRRVSGRSVKEAILQVSKTAVALACYDRRRIDALSSREIRFPAFIRSGTCRLRLSSANTNGIRAIRPRPRETSEIAACVHAHLAPSCIIDSDVCQRHVRRTILSGGVSRAPVSDSVHYDHAVGL